MYILFITYNQKKTEKNTLQPIKIQKFIFN